MELEPEMLATETVVPVYFALEDDELLSIYTQTLTSSSSQGSSSAAEGAGHLQILCWKLSVETLSEEILSRDLMTPFPHVFTVLIHTATANGFQMVTSGAQSKAVSDWAITSLEVRILKVKPLSFICFNALCSSVTFNPDIHVFVNGWHILWY